jgi:hypothetical protein
MVIPEKSSWAHGIVPCEIWWHSYQDLDWVNEPFNDSGSVHKWQQLGYTQSRFTGDLYDMRSPEPDWIDRFRVLFDWQHFSWSVYRMMPGTVLPNHSDTYARFCKIHNIADPESVFRTIVFMEDWHSGHYFEIDGSPITEWVAGEYVTWRGSTPHIAANMGHTPRYTLQLTGIPNENSLL